MYLARYGSGKDSFVVAAVGMPRPSGGASPRAQHGARNTCATLRQALSCQELDIGIRLTASGAAFRRDLLLAATSGGEAAILDLCRSFHRLDGFEAGSVALPDRATHDGIASNFSRCRGHVSRKPFRLGDCEIACDFRAYGALETMMAAANRTGHAIEYQANICRNRFDPEGLRQARKNLVRLSERRNVPRPLLEHQMGLVEAMTKCRVADRRIPRLTRSVALGRVAADARCTFREVLRTPRIRIAPGE